MSQTAELANGLATNATAAAHDLSMWGLFIQASPLVKGVMLMLIVMSLWSWTIIVQRWRVMAQARNQMENFEDRFWSGIELSRLFSELTSRKHDSVGLELVFVAGFKEFMRLRKLSGTSPDAVMDGSSRAMRIAMAREVEGLEAHLNFLATVGSISPYIGLFGTVWGIMHSFIALGSVQQATLSQVAPGIAEALVATAIGLFAAIPAVIFYNRFSSSVEFLANRYANFTEEFTSILHRQAHAAPTAGNH